MEPNQPPSPPQSDIIAPAVAGQTATPAEQAPPAPAAAQAGAAQPRAAQPEAPAGPKGEKAPPGEGQRPRAAEAPARRERESGQRRQRPPGERRPERGPGDRRPGGGGREGRAQARPQHQPWSRPDFLARAVEGGIDRAFIESASEFARSMGPNLNSGLVRGIYGEVMRQEMTGFDSARFLLLKPRLAYIAARAGRSEARELRAVLERGVEKVCAEGIADEERAARFERFTRCFEAILAYHRVHERKGGERA